jgi:NADH-quinone oxidoreductase subunit L
VHTVLALLIIIPLAGAALQVLLGSRAPRRMAEFFACSGIILSFVMAVVAFASGSQPETFILYRWISVDNFSAAAAVRYDFLAAIMALMVTFVSSLIMIYSVSFMGSDRDYRRFFCYLSLFVFFMLVIVLADNLVFLFLGWEGVGFCSYALIGFWYEDEVNASAGRKAFLLTRIGDVGFVVALGLIFINFNTLAISGVNQAAHILTSGTAMLIGLLLFWAATGKSAQLPLLVWLPDAMAGPTPVSALIHAATMVTAGVYLLVRMYPIISLVPEVLQVIGLVGSITALYAACAALVQRDIKRVLAYSTISQVGYMFLAVGAGDIVGSIFHLLTHAFFKSLLFLAAGCIIHALNGEHDILRMGSQVRRKLPLVFLLFLAGGLALGGVPPTAGYFSKGRILLAVLSRGTIFYRVIWGCATLTAFLTTLYTFRLVFLVFSGQSQTKSTSQLRPVPVVMALTLWPLAILALTAGLLNMPQIQEGGGWLANRLAELYGAVSHPLAAKSLEWLVQQGDSLLAIGGVVLAYFLYGPKDILGWRGAEPFGPAITGFLQAGFNLDRVYVFIVVRPYRWLANFFWREVDESVLDRTLVKTAGLFPAIGAGLRSWTTGYISTTIKMLLVGFAIMLVFLTF